jgi:hypothetical protein
MSHREVPQHPFSEPRMHQIRNGFLVVAALLVTLGGCASPSELACLDPLIVTFNHLSQPEQIGVLTLG